MTMLSAYRQAGETRRQPIGRFFELGEDIAGPGITRHDVLDATPQIRPGIELRARAERAPTSAADLIMRNAMATHFVAGDALADWPSFTPTVALSSAMTIEADFCQLGRVGLSVAAEPFTEVDA
jgi:2-keto-4-pentenoate hydratase